MTLVSTVPSPRHADRDFLDAYFDLFRREPLFAATGFVLIACMFPTVFAMAVDERTLQGVNLWIKPLKFQASLALYVLTLAWFAAWLPRGTTETRWYRVYAAVVAGSITLEMIWLVYAAAIGEASHFNKTSPILENVYFVMGALAVMLTSASLVYGVQIRRNAETGLSPAIKAGVVQGLVLTFILTLVAAGFMSSGEGHLIGGNASDAEGAAIVGWARDGGDLRVAHFLATHAMQFIPAFAVASALLLGRDRVLPVTVFSAVFAALTLATLAQALMGQPFLAAIL